MSMKEMIDYVARELADYPDEVEVTEFDENIDLRLHPDDVGRLVGRRGRTAKALRTLIEVGGTRYRLDIDAHGADDGASD